MAKKEVLIPNCLIERLNDEMGFFFVAQKLLYKGRTKYQDIEFYEVKNYGKVLRLDSILQTSEKDEFLYHEPLIHIAGMSVRGPKKALVIGGGDGGSIEELLKYPTLEKLIMVDLDQEVVELCKKYIPSISKGAFDSPKLELRFEDGIEYVKNTQEEFDQIVLDLTDPLGPSLKLYTKEFYSYIKRILKPEGMLSLHIESPISRPESFSRLYWTLKSVFAETHVFLNYVPLYGTLWGFAVASQKNSPWNITKEEIAENLKKWNISSLKYYTPDTHFALLTIPPYIQEFLSTPKEPYTEKNISISAETKNPEFRLYEVKEE